MNKDWFELWQLLAMDRVPATEERIHPNKARKEQDLNTGKDVNQNAHHGQRVVIPMTHIVQQGSERITCIRSYVRIRIQFIFSIILFGYFPLRGRYILISLGI